MIEELFSRAFEPGHGLPDSLLAAVAVHVHVHLHDLGHRKDKQNVSQEKQYRPLSHSRSQIGSLTDNAFDEVVLLCVLQNRNIFQAPSEQSMPPASMGGGGVQGRSV